MQKVLVLLVASFAFLSAACGASDDGTVAKGDSESEFCNLARKFSKDFKDTTDAGNAKDEAALFKDLRSAIDQLEQKAPAGIKTDITVIAVSFRESDDLLKKYDYDFTKVPEQEASKVSLDDPKVTESNNRVESYFEKTCRIDVDGDGDTDGVIDSTTTTTTAEGD